MKNSWYRSSLLYLCIGVFNTCVGYGIIFGLIFIGAMPEIANIIGYAIGFIVSYLLNKKYTFASPASHKRDLPRFGAAMSIAYIMQFLAMSFAYRICGINEYFAQIIGGAIYVLCGFVLSKVWAFKSDKNP